MISAWSEWTSVLVPGVLQCLFAAWAWNGRCRITPVICYLCALSAIMLGGAIPYYAGVLLQIACLSSCIRWNLRISWTPAAMMAVIAVLLTQISFGMVSGTMCLLLPLLPVPLPDWPSLACSAAGSVLSAALFRFTARLFGGRGLAGFPLPALFWPASFVLVVQSVITCQTYSGIDTEAAFSLHVAILVIQIAGLAAAGAALSAGAQLQHAAMSQSRSQVLDSAWDTVQETMQVMRERLSRTRKLRHNWHKYVRTVRGLLGRGELAQADLYLQQLEQAVDAAEPPHTCGCTAVDLLLAQAVQRAEEAGGTLEVRPFFVPQGIFQEKDLIAIFAAALDMCLLSSGSGSVRISAVQQGGLLMLHFSTTRAGAQGPAEDVQLASIRDAAGRYGGSLELHRCGLSLSLSVLLDISAP